MVNLEISYTDELDPETTRERLFDIGFRMTSRGHSGYFDSNSGAAEPPCAPEFELESIMEFDEDSEQWNLLTLEKGKAAIAMIGWDRLHEGMCAVEEDL